MSEEAMPCRSCGRVTTPPPEDWAEWTGLCPGCVIRTNVFPLITDRRLLDLMEVMITHCQEEEAEVVQIHVLSSEDEGLSEALKQLKVALHRTLHDKEGRELIRRACDEAERSGMKMSKIDRPILRNDPRLG